MTYYFELHRNTLLSFLKLPQRLLLNPYQRFPEGKPLRDIPMNSDKTSIAAFPDPQKLRWRSSNFAIDLQLPIRWSLCLPTHAIELKTYQFHPTTFACHRYCRHRKICFRFSEFVCPHLKGPLRSKVTVTPSLHLSQSDSIRVIVVITCENNLRLNLSVYKDNERQQRRSTVVVVGNCAECYRRNRVTVSHHNTRQWQQLFQIEMIKFRW